MQESGPIGLGRIKFNIQFKFFQSQLISSLLVMMTHRRISGKIVNGIMTLLTPHMFLYLQIIVCLSSLAERFQVLIQAGSIIAKFNRISAFNPY